MELISGTHSKDAEKIILDAWADFNSGDCVATTHYEHGQWWMTCYCGKAWSVNDCNPCSISNFHPVCFEEVSSGNNDDHEEDK